MLQWLRMLKAPHGVVLGAGTMALAISLLAPAIAATVAGPYQVNDSLHDFAIEGNTTHVGGVGVEGQNAGTAGGAAVMGKNFANHGIGVEGTSANTTFGTGVYGAAKLGPGVAGFSSSLYAGVMGSSDHADGTGVAGFGSGDAVYGLSSGENGVVGITKTSGATGKKIFAGVLGIDDSAGGQNQGVAGTTATPRGAGVSGFGTFGGTGVYAQTDSGSGLSAYNTSSRSAASLALGSQEGGYGLLAYGDTAIEGHGSIAVQAYGSQVGVEGLGPIGLAGYSSAPANADSDSTAVYLQAPVLGYVLEAYCSSPGYSSCGGSAFSRVMDVDWQGNMKLTGSVTAPSVTQLTASTTTRNRRISYDTAAASPTLEDDGEATLVNGSAAVPLDPAFADSIDRRTNYLVFLTPMGDTAGLYVAARMSHGFVVREHGNVHSNLAFDYRIVARPAGRRESRLPLFVAARARPSSPYRPDLAPRGRFTARQIPAPGLSVPLH